MIIIRSSQDRRTNPNENLGASSKKTKKLKKALDIYKDI
jgi:hypothetical protein